MIFRPRALATTAAVLSTTALLVWFGEGLRPIWFLAWLAPIPVLLYSFRATAMQSAVVTATAWALGRGSLAVLFRELDMPSPIIALLIVAPALLVAALVLLTRSLVLMDARTRLAGALAFPAGWVAVEYFASNGPDGTWGALGHSQLDALAVVQIASVTGVWGVSFIVLFAASGAAIGIHAGDRKLLTWTGAVVLALTAFGAWRLHSDRADSPTLRVGQAAAVQTDAVAKQVISGEASGAQRAVDAYAPEVDELSRAGASVIVLPEEIAGVRGEDRATIEAKLASLAAHDRVTLIVGLRLVLEPRGRNVALVFSPSGALVGEYTKQHLVARWESTRLTAGNDLAIANEPTRFGVAICKDMDFPEVASRYSRENVGVLFVPAWDFRRDGWLHSRMAIMRGIEQGLPIVRSAQEGQLTVSDAYGRVLAQSVTGDAPVWQLANSTIGHKLTIYGRYGDVFAYFDIAMISAILGLWAWRVVSERKRRGAAT